LATYGHLSRGRVMPGSVRWKSKADDSRHKTGSSTCKSSPLEAFDEQEYALPRNPMEGDFFDYAYFVDVTMTKDSTTGNPALAIIQIGGVAANVFTRAYKEFIAG
jgi:hypothetical protein